MSIDIHWRSVADRDDRYLPGYSVSLHAGSSLDYQLGKVLSGTWRPGMSMVRWEIEVPWVSARQRRLPPGRTCNGHAQLGMSSPR